MLSSFVFTLVSPTEQPAQSESYAPAGQALFLQSIAQHSASLAAALHAENQTRPYTVSNLWGFRPSAGFSPAQPIFWRITTLDTATTLALSEVILHGGLAINQWVRFDDALLQIVSVTNQASVHEWAGNSTYDALAAPWMLAKEFPTASLTLQMVSPTCFKSDGKYQILPLPHWVLGGLLDKYNAFANVSLSPDVRRFAETSLVASGLELHSQVLAIKGGRQPGVLGRVRYSATHKDRFWLSACHLLCDFAFFAGLGRSTSLGLGQARRM
jgi:CRISPR-associated endoribonuclease Cas6